MVWRWVGKRKCGEFVTCSAHHTVSMKDEKRGIDEVNRGKESRMWFFKKKTKNMWILSFTIELEGNVELWYMRNGINGNDIY